MSCCSLLNVKKKNYQEIAFEVIIPITIRVSQSKTPAQEFILGVDFSYKDAANIQNDLLCVCVSEICHAGRLIRSRSSHRRCSVRKSIL